MGCYLHVSIFRMAFLHGPFPDSNHGKKYMSGDHYSHDHGTKIMCDDIDFGLSADHLTAVFSENMKKRCGLITACSHEWPKQNIC